MNSIRDFEYCVSFAATYAECKTCRSFVQVPMPDFEMLSSFYPTDCHSKVSGGLLKHVRNALRFAGLRSLLKEEGAILDYGSGYGDFLVWLSDRLHGRDLYGYEIGEKRVIEHRASGAVTLVKGDPAYAADVIPQCSLITLNHVIEHLPDPRSTVQLLKEKLAPGGVFTGQTPAARSLEHRVFGTRWSGYHAPRHTVVFSHAGLETFLRDLGFQDIKVLGGFNPAGLAVSVASVMDRGLQGGIVRSGAKWMACLGAAVTLAPIDFLSGSPGIVNFQGSQPL